MARKTKSEAARTRNDILDAAEAEMQESGVSGASFARIAQRANVTRGAIYWHFKDRNALLSAMVARTFPPLRDVQNSLHAECPDQPVVTIVRAMLLHSLTRLATDPHHRRVCHIIAHCCEDKSAGSPVGELMRAGFQDAHAVVTSLCADAAANARLQPGLDGATVTDMVMAFLCGVYDCSLRYPDLFPIERDWTVAVDAFLAGLFLPAS